MLFSAFPSFFRVFFANFPFRKIAKISQICPKNIAHLSQKYRTFVPKISLKIGHFLIFLNFPELNIAKLSQNYRSKIAKLSHIYRTLVFLMCPKPLRLKFSKISQNYRTNIAHLSHQYRTIIAHLSHPTPQNIA